MMLYDVDFDEVFDIATSLSYFCVVYRWQLWQDDALKQPQT